MFTAILLSLMRGVSSSDSCQFPFIFEGEIHHSCAEWHYGGEPAGTTWCSTRVDSNREHVTGFYKLCPTSSQIEGPCQFPFIFEGETHHSCAQWIYGGEPAGTSWCSTRVDREGHHVNGFYRFCPSSPDYGISYDDYETPCPPPPGKSPPPGCSLTFIQDQGGQIDCQEDEDCPYR